MEQKLHTGDILIFQAEDKWISKLIAWGTFSDVSHAAMVMTNGQMVEMGLDGIMLNLIGSDGGDPAYQLRLDPPQDTAPLAAAAARYLDQRICYDIPALVLLGIALIFRHLHPSGPVYSLLDQLITAACVELDKLINKILGHPDAMVCSQLVYQIYQDCGTLYHLQVRNGALQAKDSADTICLADCAASLRMEDYSAAKLPQNSVSDIEKLSRELMLALYDAEDIKEYMAPPQQLVVQTKTLLTQLEKLAKLTDQPLESLLVMPSDLVYHTDNLCRVNTVSVKRLERLR